MVFGLTEPTTRKLTVGALLRYWRNEYIIFYPDGLPRSTSGSAAAGGSPDGDAFGW
jgi:hypothetical protein